MSFKQVEKKLMNSKPMKVYFKLVGKVNKLAEGTKDETSINPKTHIVHKIWTPSERLIFGLGKE